MYNLEDLIGQVIGQLTVIRLATKEEKESLGVRSKDTYYLCRCSCGNEKFIRRSSLKAKTTTSCGCAINKKRECNANSHIGERFGKLTIQGWHRGNRPSDPKRKEIYYDCLCDCGKTISTPYRYLKRGITKSCGCLTRDVMKEKGLAAKFDLQGQRFGRLTVIEEVEHSPAGAVRWKCKCDCGAETIVASQALRQGNIQSCGCILSKGEEKINSILTENNFKYKKEFKFEDLKSEKGTKLRFDYAILNDLDQLEYLIEYDGEQHFYSHSQKGWATKDRILNLQIRDHKKNQYCFSHNIPLIRIPYSHYDSLVLEDLKLETTSFLLTKEGEQDYVLKNTPKKHRKNLVDYYKLQKDCSTS